MGAGGKPQTVQAARQGWSMGSILNVDSLYLPAKAVAGRMFSGTVCC